MLAFRLPGVLYASLFYRGNPEDTPADFRFGDASEASGIEVLLLFCEMRKCLPESVAFCAVEKSVLISL